MINEQYYKTNNYIKIMTLEHIEMFFLKKIYLHSKDSFDYYSYFLEYLRNMNKYNLDEESFFLEFKSKILDG